MTSRRASRAETPAEPEQAPRPGSKGRPTRSRREAEAARRRPLVATDRRAARRQDRRRASEERRRAQTALSTGDEANMPAQHRGPERRFVRDVVDSRHNLAEYFLILAIVVLVASFLVPMFAGGARPIMSILLLIVMWGGILACIVDGFVLRSQLRRRLTERFGDVGQGLVSYGVMRALQFRRFRLPKPQVRHGETPRR